MNKDAQLEEMENADVENEGTEENEGDAPRRRNGRRPASKNE